MSRVLSLIGILLTTLYLGLGVLLFWGRVDAIVKLPPNELGDFLAGVFGPLAILWLILGFFQQGIELRQNTKALELQAEELRNSVEQQEKLAEVSRRQLEAELETIQYERERQRQAAQPNFQFSGVGGSFSGDRGTYVSTVRNVGNAATQVLIRTEPPLPKVNFTEVFAWQRGEEKRLEWTYGEQLADKAVKLTMAYIDATGLAGTQMFDLVPNFDRSHNMVEVSKRAGN
jgi:hypothetical protein